jgi:hypothetical protein
MSSSSTLLAAYFCKQEQVNTAQQSVNLGRTGLAGEQELQHATCLHGCQEAAAALFGARFWVGGAFPGRNKACMQQCSKDMCQQRRGDVGSRKSETATAPQRH